MFQRFFVFIQAEPGKAHEIALALARRKIEQVKDLSSISGKWDLLLRVEIDNRRDVSQDVIAQLFELDHIKRTKTVIAYAVYDPADLTVDDDFDRYHSRPTSLRSPPIVPLRYFNIEI